MKYEIKIEFADRKPLKQLIEKCYFDGENNGRLRNKDGHLVVSKSDHLYIMLKGLNNMTVRITNGGLIDGCSRFVIDETDEGCVRLYPCSIYCIVEHGKTSFY